MSIEIQQLINRGKQTVIAGPCAMESQEQISKSTQIMLAQDVDIMRTSLVKPRTRPGGFEGIGAEQGIPLMLAVARNGLVPATEVMMPHDARQITNAFGENESLPVMLWLGARNQNHLVVRKVAEVAKEYGHSLLMLKMYRTGNEKDVLGAVEHVLSTGFPQELLSLCFAGIDPSGRDNPLNHRNLHDKRWMEWALNIGKATNLPVLFDPSHATGNRNKIVQASLEALELGFDGLFVEVHPDPENALTDNQQQISPEEFNDLMAKIGVPQLAYA